MEVLKLIKVLFRINGVLTISDSQFSPTLLKRLLQRLFLLGMTTLVASVVAFCVVYVDDLQKIIPGIYIIIGSIIAIVMQVSLYHQSIDIQNLLNRLELLVNESA